MSSILKALKRIEVQSSRSDSFFTIPKTTDTKPEKNPKARRRWFLPSLIIVSLTLLVVVIAAIIFFGRQKPLITKKFPDNVSAKQGVEATGLLAKSNVFRAKITQEPKNQTKSRTKQVQPANNRIKPDASAGTAKQGAVKTRTEKPEVTTHRQNSNQTATVRTSQPATAPTEKKSQQKTTSKKDTAVSKKTIAAKSVPSGKPAKKDKKPVKARTYDRIADSKLKLQALAWFNDASKRMAVINSHIVREGGTVEGYQVTQIRRQDVVVNDGKKSWRLEFALKQNPLN